jgi:hypothetical protein
MGNLLGLQRHHRPAGRGGIRLGIRQIQARLAANLTTETARLHDDSVQVYQSSRRRRIWKCRIRFEVDVFRFHL